MAALAAASTGLRATQRLLQTGETDGVHLHNGGIGCRPAVSQQDGAWAQWAHWGPPPWGCICTMEALGIRPLQAAVGAIHGGY